MRGDLVNSSCMGAGYPPGGQKARGIGAESPEPAPCAMYAVELFCRGAGEDLQQ